MKLLTLLCIEIVLISMLIPVESFCQENDFTFDEKRLEYLKEKGNIPGISIVAIDKSGKIHYWHKGVKNITNLEDEINKNTYFELASVSKVFTGLLISCLFLKDEVQKKQKILQCLPILSIKWTGNKNITISHLLSHTSGLPGSSIIQVYGLSPDSSFKDLIPKIANYKISGSIDNPYEYTSLNYILASNCISNLLKQDYLTLLDRYITGPLEMSHQQIIENVDVANGHKVSFFKSRPSDTGIYHVNTSAAYLRFNSIDMSKFLSFLLTANEGILYDALNLTMEPQVNISDEESYGMGWTISKNNDYYHTGMNPTFSAYLSFNRDDKVGIAVFANTNTSMAFDIGRELLHLLKNKEINNKKGYKVFDFFDSLFCYVSLGMVLLIFLLLAFHKFLRKIKNRYLQYVILLGILVLAASVFLIPYFMFDKFWAAISVWFPISFFAMIILLEIFLTILFVIFLMMIVKNRIIKG